MHNRTSNPRAVWSTARATFLKVATGGEWANAQSAATRRNLVWFWLDGFFASASDNIIATYMVVYLVTLGATQAHIGLLSALSSLSAAMLLLPGAMLVERAGQRRSIVLVGGGWARMALLGLALLPLVAQGPWLIFAAMAFAVSRDAMANLAFPAWMSMTGDIVPIEGRGRYFSSRNIIMGLAGITTTFFAGQLITRMAQPVGYQVALGVAFAIGLLSVFSFSRLSDRPRPLAYPRTKDSLSPRALLRELLSHREFATFAAIAALWNISLNIAGPFFSVFLVENLRADAAMIGLTSIATSVAGMLAQRKLGELNDRWGARRLTMISGLLIPILPITWMFVDSAWQIIPLNLLSGALWGSYNLASFNYLLLITPEARRARYSALYQLIVTISLAAGAALGSLLITQVGYANIFLTSGIGRFAAALLFAVVTARVTRLARAAPTKSA